MSTLVNRYVGSPVERIEDLRFLRGRGEYVDDLTIEGLLYAHIVRSPVAHGRLKAVDTAKARALAGVHAVITAADLGRAVPRIPLRLQPMPSIDLFRQPVIAWEKVRYVGEPVAVVVASSPAVAEDAADLVALDIETLPPLASCAVAAKDETLLFDATQGNLAVRFRGTRGDAAAAFRDAPYTRRGRFQVQRHFAMPMEPRGLLAHWNAASGKLTVQGAAKVPFFNRQTLAALMELPESAIDLIENDVGGGFGARGEFYPEDFLVPYAAWRLGRPIKWNEDRREQLIAMNHARGMEADVEIACRRDGTILGVRGDIQVDLGAYVRTNGLTGPRNVAQFFTGPYRIPNIDVTSSVLMTSKTPTGTYRAPGRYEGSFFCERLIELAARDLGIDPAEMRRRNLIADSEMPYALADIAPADLYAHSECDSGDYAFTLDRCLAAFGWDEKVKLNGKQIDGRFHGVAVGCFIEGGGAGPKELARLELEPDGMVTVYVGSTSIGQGLETVLLQIAADGLGLPMDRLRIRHGSTTYLEDGYGSFHSRSTVMGGNAILLAASELLGKIRAAAAKRLGCAADAVEIADGKAGVRGGRALAFAELAGDGLAAAASFSNQHKHTYAYGAAAAHVAVDPRTGQVDLLDYVTVEDVGRAVNPLTLHGQLIGATVQGLGGAFMEDLRYDENGQFLAGSLADYLVPTASDFPNIRGMTFEHRPSPTNPMGTKGAGEGGIIAVGGVIANAVAAAIPGVEPNELPLSPDRVWRLIQAAR